MSPTPSVTEVARHVAKYINRVPGLAVEVWDEFGSCVKRALGGGRCPMGSQRIICMMQYASSTA
jgi:hypothetical protein